MGPEYRSPNYSMYGVCVAAERVFHKPSSVSVSMRHPRYCNEAHLSVPIAAPDYTQKLTSFAPIPRMTASHTANAAAFVGNARSTTGTIPWKIDQRAASGLRY